MLTKNIIVSAGKEYISAKFASLLTKYTSDYIGQLAREGKVTSIKEGKERFVLKDEFLNYAHEQGKLKENVYFKPSRKVSNADIESIAKSNYFYEQDERELIPLVKKSEVEEGEQVEAQVAQVVLPAKKSHFLREVVLPVVAFALVVGTFAVFTTTSDEARDSIAYQAASRIYRNSLDIMHTFAGRNTAAIELSDTDNFQDTSQAKEIENVSHEERLKDSFSDHVEVIPNEDGTSGTVRPTFKSRTGNDYVYFVVPADE